MVSFRQLISSLRLYIKRLDWFLIVLLLITAGVAWLNFQSDVWLTGWDTLHPEFNYVLNFKRLISGVWREDQGLGALAAHAHMSDLPRVIILWIFDLFLPVHVVKYFYVLMTLVIGPTGIYYFLKYILNKSKVNQGYVRFVAFLASLFYFFNLITVQHFVVVFEMFAVQFAALGWIFYFITRYLEENKRKLLFWLFVVNLLSSPMAYAPQLWYVYFAAVFGYLAFLTLQKFKDNKEVIKLALVILIITLVANAYWLLPSIYYVVSGAGAIPQSAHINRLFSEEAFLQNRMYGNFRDFALFKNFLFNWIVYYPQFDSQVPLLHAWQNHLPDSLITEVGYGLFFIGLFGAVALVRKRNKYLNALIPVFLGSVFMLLNDNPPFGWLFRWLRTLNPILEEATRFPFTKFSLIFLLTITSFFAFGVQLIFQNLEKFKNKLFLQFSFALLIIVGLLSFSLPYFQGELIGSKVKNNIPDAYFQMFDWFESQSQGRILNLPMHTPYGWKHHSWGYEGAGFIWFGLDHPVLERDFDRWSPYNEVLYEQLSHALYEQDPSTFIKLLNKFDIQYLLLDRSITTSDNRDILWFEETEKMLASQQVYPIFTQDFLTVYAMPEQNNLIYGLPNLPKIQQTATYARKDVIYLNHGDYLTTDNNQIFYPFSGLMQTAQDDIEIQGDELNKIIVNRSWNEKNGSYYFEFGDVDLDNKKITYQFEAELDSENHLTVIFKLPLSIKINQNNFIEFSSVKRIIDLREYTLQDDEIMLAINNAEFKLAELLSEPIYFTSAVDLSLNLYLFTENDLQGRTQIFIEEIGESLWEQLRLDLRQKYLFHKDKKMSIGAVFNSPPITVSLTKDNLIQNCDLLSRGSVNKQITEGGVALLANNNAVACETISLGMLLNHQNYLLEMDLGESQGRNLKTSLYNWQTGRSDLTELVSGNKQNFYSILSWSLLPENHYSLYLETRSFGGPAYNEIKAINFYPYPLDIVSRLRIVENSFEHDVQNQSSSLQIISQKKIGTFLYFLEVDGEESMVGLSQSYDAGWKGFIREGLLHASFLPHAKLNGWANAWEVPAGQHEIIIIFWPQLLQFVGFAVTILALVYVSLLCCKKDK